MIYLHHMRRFASILIWLVVIAAAATSVIVALRLREEVRSKDLTHVIVEPPLPLPPPPAEEPPEVDGRIWNLRERHAKEEPGRHPERGDGAILAWVPPPGVTLLRAAFGNDQDLVISTTSSEQGKEWQLLQYNLASPGVTEAKTYRTSSAPLLASAHRPYEHSNGWWLPCYSAPGKDTLEVWCDDADRVARRLTTHDGKEDLIEASVSPDNRWVVFEVNSDRAASEEPRRRPAPYDAIGNGRGKSTIWKIGLDGNGIAQLTRGADDRFPTWSSDGETILFQRRMPDGNFEMFAMDADGKDPQPLLRTYDEDELWPSVRAGRGQIVASVRNAEGRKIRLFDVETKRSSLVASASAGPETFPSVSPDGAVASFLAPVDPADPSRLGVWIAPLAP